MQHNDRLREEVEQTRHQLCALGSGVQGVGGLGFRLWGVPE